MVSPIFEDIKQKMKLAKLNYNYPNFIKNKKHKILDKLGKKKL